jgi:hypothetical protein
MDLNIGVVGQGGALYRVMSTSTKYDFANGSDISLEWV